MALWEIWTIVFICWTILGGIAYAILAVNSDYFRYANGFETLNPIYIYKNIRVNFFGLIWVTLAFNLICPLASLGYWFYKLCTVGRKMKHEIYLHDGENEDE